MSADDREQRDQPGEREIELPVDDLNPPGMDPEAAEKVKGGLASPPAPPGVPIPYPNITTGGSSAPRTTLDR